MSYGSIENLSTVFSGKSGVEIFDVLEHQDKTVPSKTPINRPYFLQDLNDFGGSGDLESHAPKRKSKFSRVFSSSSIPSITGASSVLDHVSGEEAASHETSLLIGEDRRSSGAQNIRHTRFHPYEHKVEAEHSHNSPSLPSNYIDPKGSFPAKDAYIDTIKSQFFSLGFSFGSSFQ
jgi:hypothetical protein